MARYKVPQDIEADDKLIGPFSFRQFVYLIIAAGLGFVAFLLFQILPPLVIVPIPFIIFLVVLALPLKKDQPMETYLSAIIDFYLKPQKRVWMPGQVESTITITAPKKVDEQRTKDLSQEEAGRRLSFLADIVDTEGYAIKDSNLRDDIASEADNTQDIFEKSQTYNIDQSLAQTAENRHAQLVEQMRAAINNAESITPQITTSFNQATPQAPTAAPQQIAHMPVSPAPVTTPVAPAVTPAAPVAAPDIEHSAATIQPDREEIHNILTNTTKPASTTNEPVPEPIPEPEVPIPESEAEKSIPTPQAKAEPDEDLKNLANNSDFSVETIAKQARRLKEKKANANGEVYISLH